MRFASPILAAATLLSIAGLAGCAWTDAPDPSSVAACTRTGAVPEGLVTRDASGHFSAGGQAFVPRGIGSYPLLDLAGHGRLADVDDILDQAVALGRPVVRTNAFFDGGDGPARIRDDNGKIHPPGLVALDQVLAAASTRGVRLILVLTNNWKDYGGAAAVMDAVAPGESPPKDAFWSDPRALEAQRVYVTTLVERVNSVDGRPYAEDPTIFAWELANEARCDTPTLCQPDTLVEWARTMAAAVRNAGAKQLVAWGGTGYLGTHGEDLDAIAARGTVDILTVHVYPFSNTALRIDHREPTQRIAYGIQLGNDIIDARAALARRYHLPLLIEELGWPAIGDHADRDGERSLVLGAWLDEARRQGVGTLPWMIAERGRPDYDGLLIRPEQDAATVGALRCQ